MHDESWEKIFTEYKIGEHDFDKSPFKITASQIKSACQDFRVTSQKEVRILCKQDTRQSRPKVFKERGLFLLPIRNGEYSIIKGEGYVDIPEITEETNVYNSKLEFDFDTVNVGNSEMQHLDFAYASSLIRTFVNDESLVLTIRGRKYTPKFKFKAGEPKHEIEVNGVQTEVDAGYEGKDKVILIEAKNNRATNEIIRQIYYPFRQWQCKTQKTVIPMFFEKEKNIYLIWQFEFQNIEDYNSIRLVKSGKFIIGKSQ